MTRKTKRYRIKEEIAIQLGLTPNKSKRYRLSEDEEKRFLKLNEQELAVSSTSKTSPNDYKPKQSFVLSSWNSKKGRMMDINEYCETHGLPRVDITSYKLISHTGVPFYNIVFKENQEDLSEVDFKSIIEDVLKSIKVKKEHHVDKPLDSNKFTRLLFTDTHIAMDPNAEGTAMYAEKWERSNIMKSMIAICDSVIENKVGDTLYIDELGDFLDGYNGLTTRGGHKLPQCMTNEEAFKVGLEFKMDMASRLSPHFNKIIFHLIDDDNHAGSFGAILNHAFLIAAGLKFSNVEVVKIPSFIGHYFVGEHAFVITHGKDKAFLKFGFKPFLDSKQIEKIDHYLKENDIYRKAKYIEFTKGDSHQLILDYTTAQYFDYFSIAALSPSSEWVQTNFKKGRRGFLIQQVTKNTEDKIVIPKWL
jgi:hypothetical protein